MKYLIIYLEVEHLLNFLSQSEKGDLLDVLIKYSKDGIEPKIENKNVLNVFNFLKSKLDQQFAKSKLKAEIARANGLNGGRPADKKPKKTQKNPTVTKKNPAEPNGFLIPDYIQTETWNSFVEHRKKKKAELTESSAKLILKDLQKFEDEKQGNANLALENCIKNGWQGVFEPKSSVNPNNNSRVKF